jgi:hypothetical protein
VIELLACAREREGRSLHYSKDTCSRHRPTPPRLRRLTRFQASGTLPSSHALTAHRPPRNPIPPASLACISRRPSRIWRPPRPAQAPTEAAARTPPPPPTAGLVEGGEGEGNPPCPSRHRRHRSIRQTPPPPGMNSSPRPPCGGPSDSHTPSPPRTARPTVAPGRLPAGRRGRAGPPRRPRIVPSGGCGTSAASTSTPSPTRADR